MSRRKKSRQAPPPVAKSASAVVMESARRPVSRGRRIVLGVALVTLVGWIALLAALAMIG